jgi:uncharacterized protein
MRPFTLLIKPAGSNCNVDCRYCFYKARSPEVGRGTQRMSDEVLETLVKDYLQLDFEVSIFAWQGGEPTLMGLDFYKKAVQLQKKYAGSRRQVTNSLQTNGILLDDKWCRFLHENNFLVGISIDGPKALHDYYRLDHSGGGTFDKVMRAIKACKEHKVEFNTLTLLNNKNVEHPDELFDFFLDNGIKYLQFIPCVETDVEGRVTDFSITPQQYGEFLCRIFDRWYAYGPRKISIRLFDSILAWCLGGRHTICTFSRQCTDYIVVEHSGDCFVCDFFVQPEWRLGNILETPIGKLADSDKKRSFGRNKQNLANECLVCRHLDVCRGGCVKDRIAFDGRKSTGRLTAVPAGYFCESYKPFFDYTMPKFMQIAAAVNTGSTANSGLPLDLVDGP